MLKTLNILNRVARQDKKYNILTFNTHERYQTQMAKTGHNFYAFNYENGKEWFNHHAPVPKNYYQLPINSMYPGVVFDFILVQSKFGQFQMAQQINQSLQLPVIVLEHTLPLSQWPDENLNAFRSMVGDVNVFITDYSKNEWNIDVPSDVIYHSVDTDVFKPGTGERSGVLTVAHDFIKRDYALNYSGWNRITQGLDRKVVGATDGLSKPARNVDDLVKSYQDALVYINPSTLSPVPTSMLEAMACGCAIVSMENCAIPEFIEHGVNGYLSNDEIELRLWIQHLFDNPDQAAAMGAAARKTVEEKCGTERFVSEWNNIFDKTYGVIK